MFRPDCKADGWAAESQRGVKMAAGIRVAERQRMVRQVKWSAIAVILILPLVAMTFTTEVKWTGFDFLVAGMLLIGAGLLHEVVVARVKAAPSRIVISSGLLLAVALIWAEGAVGLF